MSGRIERAFTRARKAKRAAFIPYITAGDPNPERTVVLARRTSALRRGPCREARPYRECWD